MSFDFDPNLNIDREEVDNDPQDNDSLAGGEGLYGRVPGGPQVGAANIAQARGGVGQARGGPVPRSAGQAPSPQGTLGRIPSHLSLAVSAASASVLPTSGYFGSQKRQAVEINARRVICPKHARGAHGSRDYARHQEAATKAIPYPFASAKHFHAKNADGEASNKYANLQSEYAGNLAKIKTLKRRMDAWDMISPFVIPDFIDPYALSVENRWGDRKLTGVNLLKNWGKVTLKQCRNWQRDSFDYACTEDLTSMEWAKSLMMNSCDVLLVDRIDEKFDELDLYEQGGVTYIKIALDEMFTISNTVVTTLQGFFEAFAKEGIAKVPNEDVRASTEQIVAVAERLAEVSALPTESTRHILEGFTRCSVIVFRQTFAHLLVAERLQQLRYLTNRNDSSRLIDIKRLCKEANDLFNSLNVSNEWNIPSKHCIDACFNCGDPDHGVPKCPKPIDQHRIDKAKAEFSKNGGGRGGRGGRGSGGRFAGRGRGDGGNQTNTRGKWKGNDAKVSAALTTNSGIGKHNGKWSMVCKSCGWNTTHTTGFHDKWVADPKSFSLPATHLFWSKSGKTPPEGGGGGSTTPTVAITPTAASGTSVGSLSLRVGPLIAQYKTNTEDGQFASFLADFERVLN